MLRKFFSLFFIVKCIESSSANAVPFQRPCKDMSPECLKKTIQAALPFFAKGAPELGIEPLDPYVMEQLNLTLGGGITVQLRDGYAKGLKKCVVDFARLVGNTLESQMHCNLTIKGKYKSSGELLMFPINGDGESMIKCYNLRLHSILKAKRKVGSDGHEYLDIVSSKIDHSYDGRVTYHMTNLFNGNPEISNAIVEFMNQNWKMIADEFGKPIVDYGIKSVMKNVKKLFQYISLSDLQKM